MNTRKPNFLKPRWSKVLADLWGDKTRTLLVVASIMVGVFAIGMILSAYAIIGEDFNHSYAAANPPNIEIWTGPFDADLVKSIENVPGVRDVKGVSITPVRVRRGGEPWQTIDLVGVDDFTSRINRVTTIEGMPAAGESEIVVSQDFLHITGYRAGDRVEIEFPDKSKRMLRVAGLIMDQTKSKPDPGAANYASITLKTLDEFGQNTDFNRLYVTVDGDGGSLAHIAAVADGVKDKLEKSGRSVYRHEEKVSNVSPIESLALTVMNVLLILGGLTAILSSTLIINMLNALLTQQMRQIGVMKLVGGRSRQVMGMYLALVVAYSLAALIVAVPLGAAAGYQLAQFIAANSGATLQGFRVIPLAVAVQALMAFLIPLAAGYAPVRSGAKTSVQQAISNSRPSERFSGGGLLGGQAGGGMDWLARPALVSIRNTFRKKGRLLLTIFTLTVAGAVFMAVFNIRGSLNDVLNQLIQHFMGDVTLEFRREYRVDDVEGTLLEVPGVTGVEGWSAAAGEVWDDNGQVVTRLSISAPPQDTKLLHLKLAAGRWLLPGEDNAIVISDTIHETYPGLQPGDRLTIKLPGRHEAQWTVVGIFPFLSMFGDPIAYANYDFIAAQNFTRNQASAYRLISNVGPAAQPELIQRIEQRLAERNFQVLKVQSGAAFRKAATSAIGMLIAFLLIMAILIAVVGSIGLAGTMSMNVLERTREIGVMRTIGASDGAIMRSVITEALIIGLITWVLAIGLSFPISSLLATVIGKTLLESTLPLDFTPAGVFMWLGLVALLSVIASVAPARNAARLTINEVLAYE